MANIENLKTLSPIEARKFGRSGGIASGEARRRKRDLRFCLLQLMEMPVTDSQTGCEALAMSIFQKALSGDIAAAKLIYELSAKAQNIEAAEDITLFFP